MKRLLAMATVATALAASADEWKATVEAPVSGDRVVLNDKTYVLMSEEDYAAFQDKINFFIGIAKKRWAIQHSTEGGRREWHGAKVGSSLVTNEQGKVQLRTEYADGYVYCAEGASLPKSAATSRAPTLPKPPSDIDRLRARRNGKEGR